MELLLEENAQAHYNFHKQSAAKRNPVEVKIQVNPDEDTLRLLDSKMESL